MNAAQLFEIDDVIDPAGDQTGHRLDFRPPRPNGSQSVRPTASLTPGEAGGGPVSFGQTRNPEVPLRLWGNPSCLCAVKGEVDGNRESRIVCCAGPLVHRGRVLLQRC